MKTAAWTIPAERMKIKREHRVPLSARALGVLGEAHELWDGAGLAFPSVRGRPLTDSTISKLVREKGIKTDPHGFRSSFRIWCAECSDAPREVCELARAHGNLDRVDAVHVRTDLFERRRRLMEQWSEHRARQTSRVTVGRSSRNVRKLCSAVRSAAGSARSLQCDHHDTELRHALRRATLATSRTGLSQNVSGMLRGLLALAPAPRLCAGCHRSARRRSGSRGPILGSCDIWLWRRPSRPLGGLDRC